MADDPKDEDSVRARRAERAKKEQGGPVGSFAQRHVKAYALIAGLLLAGMGVYALVEYMPKAKKGERNIHNHAAFKIIIGEEELDMHKCEFDLGGGCPEIQGTNYLGGHLHYEEDLRYMLHIEHAKSAGTLSLGRYFERGPKFTLTNTSLQLDARVYNNRLIANNDTHSWQLWVQYCVKRPLVWERLMDLPRYEPQQHDRFVLIYTDKTLEDLRPRFEQVPTSEDMLQAGGGNCPVVKGVFSPGATSPSG